MNLPCPVHGSRRAHRGCHFCRRPICRLCEVKMRGHLYCSPRCARDAGRLAIWNGVRQRMGQPISSRLAVLTVLFAVCAPTLLAVRAVSQLDRLNTPPPLPIPRRQPNARITTIVEEADGSRIEGEAPPGTAVFLFARGQFIGAVFSPDGHFRFDSVHLAGPYRVGALFLGQEVSASPLAGARGSEESRISPRAALAQPMTESAGRETATSRASEVLPGRAVPDLTRGPQDRREVLLSFDAGSSDRGAEEILDTLKRRNLTTTIFLTGDFIRRYPALTQRIAGDGHEVGNHTDTHPHLTTYAGDGRQTTRPGVHRAFLDAELAQTADLFRKTTGREIAPLWRAPYGEQNAEIRRWAAQAGYWHVGWTAGRAGLDGLDWISDPLSPSFRSARGVVERLISRAENGGIMLLHLGSNREDPVASEIPTLLDGLALRGFRLVRASEFLDRQGWTPERLAALASPPKSR